MNEGGQSSTGQLIDFMVTTHPAYPKLQAQVKETGKNMFELLGERLEVMRKEKGVDTASTLNTWVVWLARLMCIAHLTKDLHFYPDLVCFSLAGLWGICVGADRPYSMGTDHHWPTPV